MIFIGFALSLVSVTLFQKQSFVDSFVAELGYITAYATLAIYLRLNVSKEYIMKILWWFMVIFIFINILNRITFPTILFGVSKDSVDSSRGFMRLAIQGMDIFILFWFYYIHRFAVTGHRKYLGWLCVIFSMIVLSLTRQIMLWSLILGALLYLSKLKGAKKVAAFAIVLFIGVVIIPQTSVYKNLAQATERESAKTDGLQNNVRVEATLFYLTRFQTNDATYIMGNGVPALEKSEWGKHVNYLISWQKSHTGYNTGDVGWAGFFWYFGAIATIGLIALIVNTIRRKKGNDAKFLNYWLIYFTLTAFTSAPNLYWHQVSFFCLVLYLSYAYSSNNSRIQQRVRHNQLSSEPATV